MDDKQKLILLRVAHTVIWILMNIAVFYCLYCVIVMRFNAWFWAGLSMIGFECLLLLCNGMNCPLNTVARRYTDDHSHGFDIYIPPVIAKYNIQIYSVIMAAGAVIFLLNKFR